MHAARAVLEIDIVGWGGVGGLLLGVRDESGSEADALSQALRQGPYAIFCAIGDPYLFHCLVCLPNVVSSVNPGEVRVQMQ